MTEKTDLVTQLLSQVAALAPQAALVLGVLFGGLLLSWIGRRVAGWLVRRSGLETALERAGAAQMMYKVGLKDGFKPVAEAIAWYGGLLITMATLAEVLGLTGIREGIGAIIAYLPRLLAAGLLGVGGMWLAGLLRTLVDKLGKQGTELESPSALGQVVYALVLTLTATIGLDQLGIQVQLLSSLMQIAMGSAAVAMALAFALGGRLVFENLIARHYYKALVGPGDRIRVGDVEGTVVRVSPVAVIVASARGEVVIPCSTLLSGITEIRRLGGPGVDDASQG